MRSWSSAASPKRARCWNARARWRPRDARIHYNLGLLFSDLGQARDALAAFDESLLLNPDDAKAHNNRGSALQMLGRLSEAGEAFRRALDLRPDLELPYLNLGKLLEKQSDVQGAVEIYDLAIARGLDRDLFGQNRAAVLGQSTERSPDRWVIATFDNFAPTFDAHLAKLQYNVPRQLAAMLQPHARPSPLDPGLGLRHGPGRRCDGGQGHRFVGVDLSPKMLAQARDRNVYAQLDLAEIHAWLRDAEAVRASTRFAPPTC